MAGGYGAGGDIATPAVVLNSGATDEPSAELQARAEEKREFVQSMIRNMEVAIKNSHKPEEKKYLKQIVNSEDPCFRTLINLLTLPKYAGFVALRCVVLRAVQMILKVAVNMVNPATQQNIAESDANSGMRVLQELVGKALAAQAFKELCIMVERTEQELVACDAMLVLAELGPEAFDVPGGLRVQRLLELFAALPDRAHELVEVALRVHAWGGANRQALLEAAVNHDGGRYMGEVLLQVVNRRSDRHRRLRAVKLYSGCFAMPNGAQFLYTNDKRVLVEILMRELPTYSSPQEFVCYAECYRALVAQCEMARSHLQQDALQLFGDLSEGELNPPEVREKCKEVLALLTSNPS